MEEFDTGTNEKWGNWYQCTMCFTSIWLSDKTTFYPLKWWKDSSMRGGNFSHNTFDHQGTNNITRKVVDLTLGIMYPPNYFEIKNKQNAIKKQTLPAKSRMFYSGGKYDIDFSSKANLLIPCPYWRKTVQVFGMR